VLVFVPGFMQRADAWADVARIVGERYPCTCVDFATHTLDERIAELRDAVDGTDVVAGYSLGGRLALHAVLRGLQPRALVLVGCSAGIDDPAERTARREADERLAAWMEGATAEQVVARWESNPVFSTQPGDVVARQRPGRLSHRPGELATLLRTAGQGAMAPVWDELPKLALRVLAIAGERDATYVDAALRMAALLPNGEARLIAGAGHAAQLERPAETARAILDFVAA
jgi:2-succinyl-6-hydroxy-2,4-cyclohexadiene-1-carboxylate synthase